MAAKTSATKPATKPAKKYGTRSDLGASIDGYLAKLEGEHRAICDALVALIYDVVPDATAALKWGMPMFSIQPHRHLAALPAGGKPPPSSKTDAMLCYLRAQKEYVRFGFPVRGVTLSDPRGVLYGEGDGKHVRIDRVADMDTKRIGGWIKAVAKHVAAGK